MHVTLYLYIYYQYIFLYKSQYIMVDIYEYKTAYILGYINTYII